MGEIKQSLAAESENGMGESSQIPSVTTANSSVAQAAVPDESSNTMPAIKKESISIELKPNQATEVKLAMPKDASVTLIGNHQVVV
jgi:hypothetical protein